MIKRFEEFINENGFWKSGVQRAKTNTVRQGEVIELTKTNKDIPAYEVDGFPGWFFTIQWNKGNNFNPFLAIYCDECDGGDVLITFEDTKSNGYQKKFTLNSYDFVYHTDFDEFYEYDPTNYSHRKEQNSIAHRMDKMEFEFGESLNSMLKRLPPEAFLVNEECVYDLEHEGYPILGYKKHEYYFDFITLPPYEGDYNDETLIIKKYKNDKCHTLYVHPIDEVIFEPKDKKRRIYRPQIYEPQIHIGDDSYFSTNEINDICSPGFKRALNASLMRISEWDYATSYYDEYERLIF